MKTWEYLNTYLGINCFDVLIIYVSASRCLFVITHKWNIIAKCLTCISIRCWNSSRWIIIKKGNYSGRQSRVQYSTAQHSTAQHSTAQHSTVQYSTVQYSTVQHSTVQYSTVQYSTVDTHRTFLHEFVKQATFYYKNISRGTVLWMSKIDHSTWHLWLNSTLL